MKRRRLPNALKFAAGLLLWPSAGALLLTAAESLGSALTQGRSLPFAGGVAAAVLLRLFADFRASPLSAAVRAVYVLGHELTHALAAWMSGESVHAFKVGSSGGHVEVSRSNAFIALAPYCVPVYSLLAVAAYRILVLWRPGLDRPCLFPLLMGLTLTFHLIYTFDCLWGRKQPDLAAAGGTVFSLALIAGANGLVVLLVLKVLFPSSVELMAELGRSVERSEAFWRAAWSLAGSAASWLGEAWSVGGRGRF